MAVYAVQNFISARLSRAQTSSVAAMCSLTRTTHHRNRSRSSSISPDLPEAIFSWNLETIGATVDLFGPVDVQRKIFQRQGLVRRDLADCPAPALPAPAVRIPGKELLPRRVDLRTQMERIILEEYAPPGVLINHRYEVIYSGSHRQISEHAQRGAQFNLRNWP